MEAVVSPVAIQRALPPEEAARADFYALFAKLLHSGPDGALLASLAAAAPIPGESALGRAWRNLVDASSAMDEDAAREEFETLFIGMGKSEVSAYAGYYLGAPSIDHPRIRIQADLAALGLEHRQDAAEPEDHFAGLFDAMRLLVAGRAGRAPAPIAEQRRFYETYIGPAVGPFFAALERSKKSNYYARVAALGAAFFALETESFSLD
ncbi:MAG: TorD/DmsD family molecular chaperone [Usitatibacter sp.]